MSRSPLVTLPASYPVTPAADPTVVESEPAVQAHLDALQDAECRAILEATGDGALSANEVAEACDLPLSTTYRKLDLLADAGLVDERTRVRRSGRHVSEYVRHVEDVVVSLDGDGGTRLRVSRRECTDRSGAAAVDAGSR